MEEGFKHWVGVKLTSPTIEGTVAAGTGLTMPAFTMSGDIVPSGDNARLLGSPTVGLAGIHLAADYLLIGVGISLAIRNSANSAYKGFDAGAYLLEGADMIGQSPGGYAKFYMHLNLSTVNIMSDATTGTKIGTATSQKFGFWNVTPVIQQAHIADPTDLATSITAITSINALLATLGLTAAS